MLKSKMWLNCTCQNNSSNISWFREINEIQNNAKHTREGKHLLLHLLNYSDARNYTCTCGGQESSHFQLILLG